MKNSIKNILVGTAGAAVIAGAVILGGSTPSPMTVDEFNTLMQVYDYEIKQAGGDVDLTDVRDNAIAKFNQLVLSRTESRSVTIGGHTYTAAEYMALRTSLVNKANKNTINE
ncbi:MAG: hypothetical protein EOM62_12610 [Bacteroidia bacterium]|nr:hypothetical protein [Bacteroidia bacterium]